MPIVRSARPNRDFTVVANRILNEPRLSWAARGMLVHLLSKPDHWSVNVQALINETSGSTRSSGRDAVYRTLEELDVTGYIVRKRLADGSVVTTVYEDPLTENPDEAINPNPENPDEVAGRACAALLEPVPENQDVGQKPDPEKPDLEKPDLENPDVLVKTEFIERTEVLEKPDASLSGLPAKPKTSKGTKVSLQAFLDHCKAVGQKTVPEDDPIFAWAEKTRVPTEMIVLTWQVFKEEHIGTRKQQIDWRAHFRNAVKRSWYRLWYFAVDGECRLTTAGEQARRTYSKEAA